jgi:hypothetical protein
MTTDCIHPAGHIPPEEFVSVGDWNKKLLAFMAVVDDFNVRGQRDQINHPGFVTEFHFCPQCGAKIDRAGLGMMSFSEASKAYADSKGVLAQ